MKGKKLCSVLAALCLAVGGALPASAATRSQNAAVFEAEEYAFYYPASDAEILHDGHGNFTVSGLTGAAISSDDFFITVITPETDSGGLTIDSSGYPVAPSSWQGALSSGSTVGSSTMLTVPEGSQLGTVTIRGRSIRVYEGTTDSNLLKGAGHFTGTSAWDGNVCLCGHNRGPNAWFSDLIRLTSGEQIIYQTPLGVKMYQVTDTRIVSVNDLSPLTGSVENQLTLVTCVANRPDVRLIVAAVNIG
jgi:LPXTG-site transpeptidase (sortase) family protein